MADSSALKHSGYRQVPTAEGSVSPRPTGPIYSSKSPRSVFTLFCLAATLLSLALFFVAFCADMPIADRLRAVFFNADAPSSTLDAASVKTLNGFGLKLFARVAQDGDNVVVSPASIASALSMVALGTTAGGKAEKELDALLKEGFVPPGGSSDRAVELHVANSAWVSNMVHDSYKKDVKKVFGADVLPIPKSADVVNEWVSKNTAGNIKTVLSEIPEQVVALLINAVYFKAEWKTAFDEKNTVDDSFYNDGGAEKGEMSKVKMMKLKDESFNYAEVDVPGRAEEKLKIVELPYGKKDEYSAVIVLPTGKMGIGEIASLFKEGNAETWEGWMSRLARTKLDVLAMPRFKVEYGVKSLKQDLQGMGMNAAFDSDGSDPQFLRMTEDKSTYLDDVLHKATIECSEKGTVASAATAAVVMFRSLPRANPRVVVDRPFLFTIRNRVSGALLFVARVDKPAMG